MNIDPHHKPSAADLHVDFFDVTSGRADKLLRFLGLLTPAELQAFCDGLLNMMVLADHEFERQFPDEYHAWITRQDR